MDTKLLFEKAKEAGINEIEVYRVKTTRSEIGVFNHQIENLTSSTSDVSYVRGAYNGHLGSVYVENNKLSVDEVISIIKDNATLININEPYFIYPGDESYPELKPYEGDFNNHSLAEKSDLVLALAKKVEEINEFVTCPEAEYSESSFEYVIENSNGLSVSKNGGYGVLVASVLGKKGEEVKSGYEIQLAKKYAEFDIDNLANNAVEGVVSKFGASPIVSGNYKTVVKNSVVRSLLGAFSGIFTAEAVIRKMSFLEGKEGTQVFGSNISIVDDPLCELAPSQDSFDDEGVSAKTKTVVENGVFKTFLHNLKTAKMMNTVTTGNGYKAGVSAGVGVRPSNFYVAPGDKNLEELFSECGNGFYLTDVQGLHAGINVISGDFSLQAQGFEIVDGKLGKPVNLVVASGNFKKLFNDVLSLGNDLEFKTGSIGAPSLLVSELSISGK